ncbi:MAG: tRNA pseudouridine(38-40) synthase TruA [candidate division Zixibacteria bacterium]|nr:tRNA pseudouridine(38-40) synthase TruA [candidate division Zixibacteria bacterium]
MTVEYEGAEFSGWQIQSNNRTVQGVIQDAIEKVYRQKVKLSGSGRTDAGVHAAAQVCAFGLDKNIEPAKLMYRLNRLLPDEIAVIKLSRTNAKFDPRRDAVSRLYRYNIAESPTALNRHITYQVCRRLDIDKLNKAARMLKGRHDFSAFCKMKSQKQDNHCEVFISRWFRYGGMLVYEVKANRFLHHMVRRMVSAMLAVENLKINLTRMKSFLNNTDYVRFNVPANGLVLIEVNYRKEKR